MLEPETKIPCIDDFIKQVYNRKYQSVWTCTLGQNQSGKTDWNLNQLERIHRLGLGDAFGSNIKGLKADFEIDFIEDFETLKKRCQMLNPDPEVHGIKRYFFVADEMGDWAPRDQPWLNVQLIKELQQVRKFGLSLLGSGISRIDKRVLNEKHFHGYFEKVSKANPTVAIYYDWFRGRKVVIEGIPKTNIVFNTWYSANFFMQPHAPDLSTVPLDKEHRMVLAYLQNGKSWDKTEYRRMQGKRAVDKVLEVHMNHCLKSLPKQEGTADKAENAHA
jgi:hypothetical protein